MKPWFIKPQDKGLIKPAQKESTTNYSAFLFTDITKDILIVMLGLKSLNRSQKKREVLRLQITFSCLY